MRCHFSSPKGGISLYKVLLIASPFLPATHHISYTSKGIQAITCNEFTNREDAIKHKKNIDPIGHEQKTLSTKNKTNKKQNKQNKQQHILPVIIPQCKMLHEKLKLTVMIHTMHGQLVLIHSLHNMSCLILHIKFFPPWETSISSPKLPSLSTLHCDKVLSMTHKKRLYNVTFIYLFVFEGCIISRLLLKCILFLTSIFLQRNNLKSTIIFCKRIRAKLSALTQNCHFT